MDSLAGTTWTIIDPKTSEKTDITFNKNGTASVGQGSTMWFWGEYDGGSWIAAAPIDLYKNDNYRVAAYFGNYDDRRVYHTNGYGGQEPIPLEELLMQPKNE